jgi:glutathione S-transferase
VKSGDYLLKSGFSAADTGVGHSVHLAGKFIALDPYPRVVDCYERLKQRPAFRASLSKRA